MGAVVDNVCRIKGFPGQDPSAPQDLLWGDLIPSNALNSLVGQPVLDLFIFGLVEEF